MAINEFLSFATGAGANVLSQADYDALSARVAGFQSGTTKSAQVNKAIRQAAFIAAAMGQFAADNSGADSLDNGDLATFINHFKLALQLFIGSAGYGIDTGTANAYAVAFSPAVTALSDGMVMKFKAQNANTGASTFNPNGLGAKPIVTNAGSALSSGVIPAGGEVWLQYNSSIGAGSWVLIGGHNFGGAAYAAIMSSLTDNTAGRLQPVGAFGNGGDVIEVSSGTALDVTRPSGRYNFTLAVAGLPVAGAGLTADVKHRSSGDVVIFGVTNNTSNMGPYFNRYNAATSTWTGWQIVYSGNNVSAFIQTLFDDPDGATAFATMGESHSFGANGWEKLPNGLIRQWGIQTGLGTQTSGTFSLPITFPNAIYGVKFADLNVGAGGVDLSTGYSAISTSVITYSKHSARTEFYWEAIGR